MKKLVLSNSSFQHSNAEEQKNSLLALVEASKTFGRGIIQEGLKSFKNCTGVRYSNYSVGYIETKGGDWALTLKEYDLESEYLEHKDDSKTTILLGWGFNIDVLVGEADITSWGYNSRYLIEDVSTKVIESLEETTVDSYWDLDVLIKNYKETGLWDESLVEE